MPRLRPELVVETNMTPAEIKSGMQYLMTLQRPPSAIFASSDVAVLAVVDYCFEHGIALPEQLSLATFEN